MTTGRNTTVPPPQPDQLTAPTDPAPTDSAPTGPAPAAQGPEPAWAFGRAFVLRAAGLPVAAVRGLRCSGTRRWADEVLDRSERLRAAGETLGDRLHDLIGQHADTTDDTARRALLKLRRELFNNRLPRDPEGAAALVGALDRAAGRGVADWLAARQRLADRTAEGAGLLADEVARSRTELGRLAGEERLRKGLLLASPSLDAQLDSYIRHQSGDAPAEPPGKKLRKIERSLISYLYRTACKTSPFSTFTGVALGEFTQEPGAASAAAAASADRTVHIADRWASHPRLNVVAVGRLAEAVLADPARRADLPVSLAPGWGRDDDRVRYVRRWITTGDDDTAVTFDAVKDRLFFLRRSGTLERMLALFEERPTLRYGELTDWLAAEQAAHSTAEQAPSREECERYLEALLNLGMLHVPGLHTAVHDTDPLRAFQAALRALDRDWARELADELEAPVARVDAYPSAGAGDRRELLTALRAELRAIQERLGVEQPRVPQTVLYEDAAATERTEGDLAAWSQVAAEPLRSLERVLPAFDLTLPQRVTFKGFFLARYGHGGRCDDLLKLVHDFHEDFFDQYLSFSGKRTPFDAQGRYVPEENWLGLPQLKALDTARQTFVAGMRTLWDRTGGAPDAPEEVFLDDATLDRVADELASFTPEFTPQSHHVQLAERDGDPLVVLNRSYGGLAFPFSRFTHCFDGMAERLRADAAELRRPPGAVFAEVTGGPVTSNLNLHDRLTDYEIVCPGETGTLPPDAQLPLHDLYLRHDPDADRMVLRSTRLGCEIIPVYLGYLVPLALPEIPRTLLLLSPTSMAPLNVWGGVPEGEPSGGVTRRPRVRHGSVVLSRRSWSAPASVLPLRGPGDTDDGWFLGWHRWRRQHGLPVRAFVTVSDSGARGATGAKPSYLDFDSYLSLTAFEALLRNPEARVVFREMLPTEDDLHAVSSRGRHVAELALETAVFTPPAATAGGHRTPGEDDS